MKPVSTGTGLIVLSATIAACFAASRFGGEERAFAETSATNSPAAMPSPSCVPASTAWFNKVPRLISNCVSTTQPALVTCEPLENADINGDGIKEYFQVASSNLWGGSTDYGYSTDPSNFSSWRIQLDRVELRDGVVTQGVTYVFEMDQQIHNALKAFSGSTSCYATRFNGGGLPDRQGWRDCDGDGDLDLVFRLSNWTGNDIQVWFENTGFQKSPAPNPYDLDQDGEVGAGDISVLLLNYSG
jgi:hypothetical protein